MQQAHDTHHLDVVMAVEYGVPAAIVIYHLRWWITQNKANGRHQHDDRTWTYNSINALTKIWPYWTIKQIRKIFDDLTAKGVIVKGNYSAKKNDRTMWYAFADESAFLAEYDICPKGQMDLPRRANGFAQKGKCILGTDTNEPVIKPNLPTNEISGTHFSFAREINAIIPARTISDWQAYANISRWIIQTFMVKERQQKQFELVKEIAHRAAAAKVTKRIALFFKMLADEMDYKKQRYTGTQSLGSIFNKMGITG
jgi:hypothetical protein